MRFVPRQQNIARHMAAIARRLPEIVDVAYDEFVKETPVRSGNARRSTNLRRNVIDAGYDYANRLNQGWSSQSPQGMTDPTVDAIRSHVQGILGSARGRR